MKAIILVVSVSDDDLAEGWGEGYDPTRDEAAAVAEFTLSVRAALNEVIGDDGGAYVPTIQELDDDIFPIP